jgi:general secretion pathway protein B
MSLILDALRKSEAERRRGQKPDLFANVTLSPAPRRGNLLRLWPLPVFVALVLAAGFVLWRGKQPSVSDSTPASSQASQDETLEASVEAGTENGMRPTPASSTPMASAAATARVVSERSSDSGTRAPNIAPPVTNPAPALPMPAPPVLPPTPVNATGNAEASTTPRSDAGQLDTLPPIAILSASERSALPPLKLSMHVYGDEPGKRFAIIDGQRVTEGSSLGAGIIEEIRRDGVVLNVNGRRILLPRP